jgi:hypothetical protein
MSARTARVLVRGSTDIPLFNTLVGFALGATLLGIFLGGVCGLMAVVSQNFQVVALFFPVAVFVVVALLLAAAGLTAAIQKTRRLWLKPVRGGFRLDGHSGEREYRDDQVSAMRVDTRRYSEMFRSGVRTRMVLTLDSPAGPESLALAWTFPDGSPDPLERLTQHLLKGLAARTEAELAAGGELAGDGWRLGGDVLHVRRVAVPADELTAVASYEGRVRVWRRGTARPVLSVPNRSTNAGVLRRVLLGRLGSAEPAGPDDGEPWLRPLDLEGDLVPAAPDGADD